MKRNVCILFLISVSFFSLFAQSQKDALQMYRIGRDREAKGNSVEARAAYEESVAICKQEIVSKPGNMDSYVVLGWSLFRLGRYQETINISNAALKINPREFRVIETMGETYFFLNNFSESLKLFERYIDGYPNGDRISTAYFYVGEIYRARKQFNKADIAYSMAVKKEPNMPIWWYRLGIVKEAVEDKAGAKIAFEKAVNLRPNFVEAKQGLARVSN